MLTLKQALAQAHSKQSGNLETVRLLYGDALLEIERLEATVRALQATVEQAQPFVDVGVEMVSFRLSAMCVPIWNPAASTCCY